MRQAKPGEGGRDESLTKTITETFEWSPVGVPIPTRPRWSPAGSEFCVVQGRPWLRSVNSECVGRVIEPRKQYPRRPTPSTRRKAASSPCNDLGLTTSPGSQGGARTQGLPRNLGDLFDSDALPGARPPGEQRPDHLPARGLAWGRQRTSEPDIGTAERTQGSDAGRSSRSRSAFTVATRRGNRPEGPRGAKEGVGVRHRARER